MNSESLIPSAFQERYDSLPVFVREAIDRKLPAAKRYCDALKAGEPEGTPFLRPGVDLPVPLDIEAAALVYDIAFSEWPPEANEEEYNRLGKILLHGGR